MAAGSLGSLSSLASKAGYGIEAFVGKNKEAARLIGAGIWAAIGLAFVVPAAVREKRGIAPGWGIAAIGGSLSAALAIAELLGGFSILSLVAGWLTFAGI